MRTLTPNVDTTSMPMLTRATIAATLLIVSIASRGDAQQRVRLNLDRQLGDLLAYWRPNYKYTCVVPNELSRDTVRDLNVLGSLQAGGALRAIELKAAAKANASTRTKSTSRVTRPPDAQNAAIVRFDACLQYLYDGYTEAEYSALLRVGMPSPVRAAPTAGGRTVTPAHDQANAQVRAAEIKLLERMLASDAVTKAGLDNAMMVLDGGVVNDPDGRLRAQIEKRRASLDTIPTDLPHVELRANGLSNLQLGADSTFSLTWTSSAADTCELLRPSSSGITLSGSGGPIGPGHTWYPDSGETRVFALACSNRRGSAADVVVVRGGR